MNKSIDIYISYQWDSKQMVLILYKKLIDYNLKVFMDDMGIEVVTKRITSRVSEKLNNTKVFLCCLSKNYCETVNIGDFYSQEIYYASTLNIPFIVLELEYMSILDIGHVSLLLNSCQRFSCYKYPNLTKEWTGEIFGAILKSIKKKMEKSTESNKTIEKKQPLLVLDMV
jgi:hypothetical protein